MNNIYTNMTEEIINLNGAEYKITYSGYLTQEQKIQEIIKYLNSQYLNSGNCGGCRRQQQNAVSGQQVKSLTKTCNTTTKTTGQTINLTYTPTGTGPFTVDFYRKQGAGTKIQTGITNAHQTGITSGTAVSASYNVLSTDSGDWDFWTEGLDACTNTICGTSDVCTITLNPIVVTICTWITTNGGMSSINIPNIFVLVDAYLGLRNIGFTPTIPQIFSCVDYYLGLITVAQFNTRTGCNF